MNKEIIEAAKYCAGIEFEGCGGCPLDETGSCGGDPYEFAKAIVEHHNKYRWHDLLKNSDDLPEDDSKEYLIKDVWADGDVIYTTAVREYIVHHGIPTDVYNFTVVAWREIDEYESEDSDG